jgi:hypothetical protein
LTDLPPSVYFGHTAIHLAVAAAVDTKEETP